MDGGVIGGQRSHRVGVVVVEDMASMMAQAGACGDCPASPVTITDDSSDSHSMTGVRPVPEGLCGWGNHQKLEGERMVMRVLDHWPLTDGRCKGPCTVTPRPTGMFRH